MTSDTETKSNESAEPRAFALLGPLVIAGRSKAGGELKIGLVDLEWDDARGVWTLPPPAAR